MEVAHSSTENLVEQASLKSYAKDSDDVNVKEADDYPELNELHPCCHPKHIVHRLIFLVFMSFLGFGNYFVYDNPVALESHFLSDLNLSVTQYSLLYSIYSYPNVILCFFGGFLVDRVFGLRWGAIIFSTFILIGQFIFALGAYTNLLWLALLGRFIFGLGGECLIVCQNLYGVTWFIGKELNMVLGLQLSFARVGSTANLYVMEPLYGFIHQQTGLSGYKLLGTCLFYAMATCVMSMLCAIACFIMDKRASKLLKKDEVKTGEVIKITDVKYFPLTFWFISILCVTYYVGVFPFISLGSVFFERKWDLTAQMASFVTGFPYIMSAVLSPGIGTVIDRTGYNLVWVLLSVIITLGSHAIIAFTFVNPFVGMTIMGLGYSMLACSLWPLVAYIIPEHQLGTAYGIMQSIQNAGLAGIPTAAGAIIDAKGFLQVELLYIGVLALSLFVVVFLYLSDLNAHGLLNMSSKKRERFQAAKQD